MKNKKNIIYLSIIMMLSMLMLSHSMTPHIKHYYSYLEEAHNKSTEKLPIHCHNINELLVSKSGISQQKVIPQQKISEIIYDVLGIDSYFDEINLLFYHYSKEKEFKSTFHKKHIPTRGSPQNFIS